MKKGFTLIELLAVIVILAIIATIAVPIVLSIIEDAKESTTLRNAEYYLDAVEQSIAKHSLNIDGAYQPSTCEIQEDGNLLCDEEVEVIVEVKGTKPNGVTITFNKGKIVDAYLKLSNKTIVKNSDGELVYQEPTLSSLCEFKEGTEKSIGAKYECDFGAGVKNFYILELGSSPVSNSTLASDEVALILEGNYDTTQSWCDQEGANPRDNVCAADGLTSKLNEIATAWKKLEREQIVLPSALQVATADGKVYDNITAITLSSTNAWLYNWDNSVWGKTVWGYWTSSPHAEYSDRAWRVTSSGRISNDTVDDVNDNGVRPVVNLKI